MCWRSLSDAYGVWFRRYGYRSSSRRQFSPPRTIPHDAYAGVTGWLNNLINVDVNLDGILVNLLGGSHSLNRFL
jgi:hypothetical protein